MSDPVVLTDKQQKMLARLAANGGDHVRGAEVRVVSALATKGFATIEDWGSLGRRGTNIDNERWWATITDKGRAHHEASKGAQT